MTDRDPRDPEERLLRRLTRRDRIAAKLAGPRGAAGTPKDRPLGTFPPGTEGQVWTLVNDAGDVFPMWADNSGGFDVNDILVSAEGDVVTSGGYVLVRG